LANLQFARTEEPENFPLARKFYWAKKRRQALLPTLPTTLADEQATNPFLRAPSPAALAAMRARKDVFVPPALPAEE
jgi:hydroxyacylglutathione hydrolase